MDQKIRGGAGWNILVTNTDFLAGASVRLCPTTQRFPSGISKQTWEWYNYGIKNKFSPQPDFLIVALINAARLILYKSI